MSAASGIDAIRVLFVKVRASLYDYGVHVGRMIVYWLPSSLLGAVLACSSPPSSSLASSAA